MAKSFDEIERLLKGIGAVKVGDSEGSSTFAVALGGNKPEWGATTLHSAQIEGLREQLQDYLQAPSRRFRVGDIVTPKASASIKGIGCPYIVLEVNDDARPMFPTASVNDITHTKAGSRAQIRVMTYVENDNVLTFWNEAWEFEHYDPNVHGKGK